MHHGDGPIRGEVGMGVGVGRGAMRRPTRVANAEAAGGGALAEIVSQFRDSSGTLPQMQMRSGKGGQTGAVVAAVFQATQPLDQDGFRLAIAYISNDAAHGVLLDMD